MKKIITYCFWVLLLAASVVSCKKENELPSLKETFSKNDKNPFGTYIAYDLVRQLFINNNIRTRKSTLDKSFENIEDSSSCYITISKNFYLNGKELDAMMSFVDKGNTMFISSEYFDTSFLKYIDFPFTPPTYNLFEDIAGRMKTTHLQLNPAYYFNMPAFGYFYLPLENSFNVQKQEDITILGNNEKGDPNYVLVFYGKGRFYLHCEPRAFSNYFLLQQNNYQYLQHVLSFISSVPEHVYWDDFFNRRNNATSAEEERSGFSVLLKYPAMAWAFWLTLLLLLLYIVFGSKRRQRIIKPIASNVNTSVAFTETVSRLYLQKKDNRNIADKMITYFFEHIRNQYYLNSNQVNEAFISTLSRKSNVPVTTTEQLFNTIHKVQQSATVDDQQLLSLNHQIENFYKYNR